MAAEFGLRLISKYWLTVYDVEMWRYARQIKTLSRRLSDAAEAGEAEQVADAHRKLTVLLDRASARGAIHRNTAARKKSQAARMAAGTPAEA